MAFFLTPYMLGRLGKEMYGLYALVGMFIGYVGILDFSMDSTLVKFVAEHNAKKQFPELNAVIGWGLLFYALFAAVLAAVALLFVDPALALLKIPPQMIHDARFIVMVGLCAFAAAAVWGPHSPSTGSTPIVRCRYRVARATELLTAQSQSRARTRSSAIAR